MILALLALAAAQATEAPSPTLPAEAAPPPAAPPAAVQTVRSDEILYGECSASVKQDPESGLAAANDWRMRGGGLLARACVALAYAELERWAPAAVAFEQAAREAEKAQDIRQADLWVQSGNSWLAADDGARARIAFDAALATTLLTAELRGEVHLDRARAGVALGDLVGARADLDRALELVPGDPFAWLLSAALARREAAVPRAQKDIARALELAPGDADVLLEAGNIAGAAKDMAAAQGFYERAAAAAPDSPAGKAARAALGES